MAELSRIEQVELHAEETADVYHAAIADITKRCKSSKIEIKTVDGLIYDNEYNILIKQGRGTREVNLWSADQAFRFSNIKFEDYRFIAGFSAIYSPAGDFIEAVVQPLRVSSSSNVRELLFGGRDEDRKAINSVSVSGGLNRQITLGPASAALKLFTDQPSAFSIRISGYGASRHDEALRLLQRVSDAFLFHLDLKTGAAIGLGRERRNRISRKRSTEIMGALKSMSVPKHEYDDAPLALYRYARSAIDMPLLQFLAFYQSVEFYYPSYSDIDAKRRIKILLKDPLFNAENDIDIGKIISLIGARSGAGFGNEKAQLKATLRDCLEPKSVREFIARDDDRADFYQKRERFSPFPRIDFGSDNFFDELSNRLYEIRCAIVHSKGDSDERALGSRLIPYTQEAEQLEHDVLLMKFVAERVIIASSRKS